MIQDEIHKKIVENCDAVEQWFKQKSDGLAFPFYSSYDIRDSGLKVVPVDANIFPAGFNNICQQDKDSAVQVAFEYLKSHYTSTGQQIFLVAEEHTTNPYYWENVNSIQKILTGAGYQVLVCWPKSLETPFEAQSMTGTKITVYGSENRNGEIWSGDKKADLIICNNDFSLSYPDWSMNLKTPMNPPHELGWYKRRKDEFFTQYNQLVKEFAQVIGMAPEHMQVKTLRFDGFDVDDEKSRGDLADKVKIFIDELKESYARLGIEQKPFVFLKNIAGTYGLAVTQVHEADEIRSWTYKSRKKMKAAKGGRDVESLIIQEGVSTRFTTETETAEPCVYMIGRKLVGGFLRTHNQKGPEESLNSPGAIYKKMCMSDLEINLSGCPMENVYGWLSKLSVLSIALEAKKAGVKFIDYRGL
jgi:glutamate--cysteine ligase